MQGGGGAPSPSRVQLYQDVRSPTGAAAGGTLRGKLRDSGRLVGSFFTRLAGQPAPRQAAVSAPRAMAVDAEALPPMPDDPNAVEARFNQVAAEVGLPPQANLSLENKWKVVCNFDRAQGMLEQPEDYARSLAAVATGPVQDLQATGVGGLSSRSPAWKQRFAELDGTRTVLLLLQRLLGADAEPVALADCLRALRELLPTSEGRSVLEDPRAVLLMLKALDHVSLLAQLGVVRTLHELSSTHAGFVATLYALDSPSGDGATYWQRVVALLERENFDLRTAVVVLCDELLTHTPESVKAHTGSLLASEASLMLRLRDTLKRCDLPDILDEILRLTDDPKLGNAISALRARHSDFAVSQDDPWVQRRAKHNAAAAFEALQSNPLLESSRWAIIARFLQLAVETPPSQWDAVLQVGGSGGGGGGSGGGDDSALSASLEARLEKLKNSYDVLSRRTAALRKKRVCLNCGGPMPTEGSTRRKKKSRAPPGDAEATTADAIKNHVDVDGNPVVIVGGSVGSGGASGGSAGDLSGSGGAPGGSAGDLGGSGGAPGGSSGSAGPSGVVASSSDGPMDAGDDAAGDDDAIATPTSAATRTRRRRKKSTVAASATPTTADAAEETDVADAGDDDSAGKESTTPSSSAPSSARGNKKRTKRRKPRPAPAPDAPAAATGPAPAVSVSVPPPPPPPPSLASFPAFVPPTDGSVPAPPPPPPPMGFRAATSKAPLQPRVKMRGLPWRVLPAAQVSGTVFDGMSEDAVVAALPVDELEALFALAAPAAPKAEDAESDKAPRVLALLESKRSDNINIMLSRFRDLALSQIREAIVNCDTATLPLERLLLIRPLLPTPEECKLVAEHEDDVEQMGKPERFVAELALVPRLPQRFDALIYKCQFAEKLESLERMVDNVLHALQALRDSRHFVKLLEIVLALGNYLNGGTFRGAALGFKLSTVAELSSFRTNQGEPMMSYLVQFVRKSYPDVLRWTREVEIVRQIEGVNLHQLHVEIDALASGLRAVVSELEQPDEDAEEEGHFAEAMEPFVDEAEPKVKSLQEQGVVMVQSFVEIARFFGESLGPNESEEFFALLGGFIQSFQSVERQHRLLEEKQRRAMPDVIGQLKKRQASSARVQ